MSNIENSSFCPNCGGIDVDFFGSPGTLTCFECGWAWGGKGKGSYLVSEDLIEPAFRSPANPLKNAFLLSRFGSAVQRGSEIDNP